MPSASSDSKSWQNISWNQRSVWVLNKGPDSNNSKPIGNDSNDAERGEEVSSELVIARFDAPEILEPSETALDVVADTLLPVGFARDDGPYFLLAEDGAKRIRVITFVGQKLLDARDQADAFFRHDTVRGVALRHDQHPRAEKFIDNRVDFAAALGEPDRLEFGPFSAAGTAVSLDKAAIQRG